MVESLLVGISSLPGEWTSTGRRTWQSCTWFSPSMGSWDSPSTLTLLCPVLWTWRFNIRTHVQEFFVVLSWSFKHIFIFINFVYFQNLLQFLLVLRVLSTCSQPTERRFFYNGIYITSISVTFGLGQSANSCFNKSS